MTKHKSTSYYLTNDVADQLQYLCDKFQIRNQSRMISKLIMERHAIVQMIEREQQANLFARASKPEINDSRPLTDEHTEKH